MRARGIAALCLLASVAGCAGHTTTMRDVRVALRRNDLDEARTRLLKAGRSTDDLLFALEDGLLLRYAGDPALSNSRFEFAEQRIDDLYTKSITRAALSLLTSDLILKFEPAGVENFLINYYRALNYLELEDVESAWVEWRKLNFKLQFSREQSEALYRDPPFFSHLVGLGLELDDPSNAFVSLRQAEASYRERDGRPPADLIDDLMRLGTSLGLDDELEVYRRRYGETQPTQADASTSRSAVDDAGGYGYGELIVLVEDGLVAPIEEFNAYIPITKTRARTVHAGKEPRLELAGALAREYHGGAYAHVTPKYARNVEIAYVLPLAFPAYGKGEPAFGRLAVAAGGGEVPARVALDVSDMQGAAFQDRLVWAYAKTIARALVKAAVAAKLKEEATQEGGKGAGEVVGVIANVVNVLTERADTRAWLGLPHRIWVARLRLPPGEHQIRLLLDARSELPLGPIELRAGERRFLSYRVF